VDIIFECTRFTDGATSMDEWIVTHYSSMTDTQVWCFVNLAVSCIMTLAFVSMIAHSNSIVCSITDVQARKIVWIRSKSYEWALYLHIIMLY
jgi:hypothetical protein